jgi:hypothetical protein
MILRSSTKHENKEFVMPAWMAGIHQGRRMPPETSMSA